MLESTQTSIIFASRSHVITALAFHSILESISTPHHWYLASNTRFPSISTHGAREPLSGE